MIEMLAIDGGDDGDDGREEQEAAITFVGFDDEVFAAAQARGGAGLIHPATDDEGGVEMRGGENGGDHRSGGGFAVSTADGDAVFEAHQFGKHFGARNHRNFTLVRFDDFGILGIDGRRGHNDVRAFYVAGLVALVDHGAKILQTFGDGGGLGIRSGNRVAEGQQNFGDTAHADASDAD